MGNAWVFPGQGSQKPGMAAGLTEHPLGKERFALASELLGRDLAAICAGDATGELSDLNDTRNTQPALFVVESCLVDLLHEAVSDGRIQSGQLIASSGFGAGLSWGAALLRWDGPTS